MNDEYHTSFIHVSVVTSKVANKQGENVFKPTYRYDQSRRILCLEPGRGGCTLLCPLPVSEPWTHPAYRPGPSIHHSHRVSVAPLAHYAALTLPLHTLTRRGRLCFSLSVQKPFSKPELTSRETYGEHHIAGGRGSRQREAFKETRRLCLVRFMKAFTVYLNAAQIQSHRSAEMDFLCEGQ